MTADALHLLAAAAFGHSTAQRVRLGEVEAGHLAGDEQDLLLVDDDAVGVGEHLLHAAMHDYDRLEPVPTADERRDHLGFERAGPEERYLRDDVLERGGLQPRRKVSLTAALELEHPHRVRPCDVIEDERIVLGQVERFGHRRLPDPFARQLDGVADRRVHPQTQDVHLHKAQRLDVVLVVLRDHGAFGRPLQRHPARDGIAGDDEAAEVRAEVHRTVVELLGEVEKHPPAPLVAQRVMHALGVGGEHLAQLARRDPRQVAREPVDLLDGQAERTRHHAHGAAGGHRVDGGHHRDVLAPEAPVDEVDDLVTPRGVEVDVDVGHLTPLRVQEAFEEQVVCDGVRIGDAERVGDDRVAGAPPSRVPDAARPGVVDDLLDHEEVLREPHRVDERQLVLEAHHRLGGHRLVAALEPSPRLLREHGVRRLGVRDVGRRKMELPERQLELALRRDLERGVAGARQPPEEAPHLGGGLEPQLGVGAVEGPRQRHAGTRSREHVVQTVIGSAQVVDVVGGHDRQRELLGERDEATDEPGAFGRERVRQLDVEVTDHETGRQSRERRTSASRRACEDRARRLSVNAPRKPDEPFRETRQIGHGHDRRYERATQMRAREQPAQVAVAREVAAEQREVMADARGPSEADTRRQDEAPLRGQVGLLGHDADGLHHHLASDDGHDPGPDACLIEADRPGEPLVVGERQRRHLELGGTLHERGKRSRAVHEAELRVHVKVHEPLRHHKPLVLDTDEEPDALLAVVGQVVDAAARQHAPEPPRDPATRVPPGAFGGPDLHDRIDAVGAAGAREGGWVLALDVPDDLDQFLGELGRARPVTAEQV